VGRGDDIRRSSGPTLKDIAKYLGVSQALMYRCLGESWPPHWSLSRRASLDDAQVECGKSDPVGVWFGWGHCVPYPPAQ